MVQIRQSTVERERARSHHFGETKQTLGFRAWCVRVKGVGLRVWGEEKTHQREKANTIAPSTTKSDTTRCDTPTDPCSGCRVEVMGFRKQMSGF